MADYSASLTKHIDIIQATITRMASNSFALKGWSVTLVSALFALAAKDANKLYIFVAYFPVFMFWLLDGYFLSQERVYRALYDEIRKAKPDSFSDLSMDVRKYLIGERTWAATTFSKTLRIFHGTMLGTVIIVTIITIWLT